VQPAWPTEEADLQREADLRDRIAELLRQGVNRVAEKERAATEVAAQGPVRWRRYAEAARDPRMLAAAVRLRDAFGVGEEQFGRLSAAARFNLSLYAARQQIERYKNNPAAAGAARLQNNDPALTAVVAELRQAAGDLRARPGVPELMQRVGTLDDKEPFADRRLDDVFSLQPLGADVPLEFRRVEPKARGERPFYLGTTEVSLAQFAAVVNAQTAWGRVQSLVWSPQPGDHGDARRGPRTWEWERPAVKMGRSIYWLADDAANSFPMELRDPRSRFNQNVLGPDAGGMPSESHPMQQVSAEAALFFAGLCGCRLPTPHEWSVAYEQFGKGVPPEQWNLRDRTWETQRAHAANAGAQAAAQMPDAGIFTMPKTPDGRPVSTGAAAKSGPQNDRTLYFRTVDSPELGTGARGGFYHLVGNVAELVCEGAQPFEKYNDKFTPEGVKRFAAANADGIAVIGGSALSPPELPLDKPLPVKPGSAYADVGFRLAFTAPSRSLAERLEWVLGDQDYVWPANAPGARAGARGE
jgi:formylglycine-generating enzyme required for sulfatase activity